MKTKLILLAIILLAFSVRLYKLDNPIADWHSWRQADTASVTREYVKHGINLLKPTYHDLSNIPSGKDNPQGYRMVEFPIINGLTAWIIRTFSLQTQQVIVGRYVSIFFSMITLLSLYFLGRQLSGELVGLISAFLFAVLPYSVYYSRVILPEPAIIAFSTLALALFNIFPPLSLLFFALALVLKPFVIFLAPAFYALALLSNKKISRLILVTPYLILASIPLLLWRQYITQFPEGIPASNWLFNQNNIRLKGAFFHWLFEVRLSNLILGIGLIVPFIFGLLKRGKESFFYLTWGFGLLMYLIVIAGGNVQHDYYQVLLLPFICLSTARGISFLISLPTEILPKAPVYLTILCLVGFSLFVSWYNIRGYYQINNWPIVEAGQAVDQLTPPNAKVVAPYNGDTAFLFQTNRTGWPLGFDIDQKIAQGATTYVTVSYDDEAHQLEKMYTTLAKTDHYLVLDLTSPK